MGEGCDYYIGCGINYQEIEADSYSEAYDKAREIVVSEYTGESTLESAILTNEVNNLPVDEWYKKEKEERLSLIAKAEQNDRKAQYLKLKKEFEG
jgi:hypothetical protein